MDTILSFDYLQYFEYYTNPKGYIFVLPENNVSDLILLSAIVKRNGYEVSRVQHSDMADFWETIMGRKYGFYDIEKEDDSKKDIVVVTTNIPDGCIECSNHSLEN